MIITITVNAIIIPVKCISIYMDGHILKMYLDFNQHSMFCYANAKKFFLSLSDSIDPNMDVNWDGK